MVLISWYGCFKNNGKADSQFFLHLSNTVEGIFPKKPIWLNIERLLLIRSLVLDVKHAFSRKTSGLQNTSFKKIQDTQSGSHYKINSKFRFIIVGFSFILHLVLLNSHAEFLKTPGFHKTNDIQVE